MAITIVIVDDHPVVRMGLRTLMEGEPECRIVGEAANGKEAVALVEDLCPNVLILDLMLPGMNGMQVIGEVRHRAPATRVIVLSMHSDRAYVNEAFRRGAHGYVVKDSLAEQIMVAIRTVMTGSRFPADRTPAAGHAGSASGTSSGVDCRSHDLTAREQEILMHIANGKSNKEIADSLAISVRTVETHRARIMHKLDLRSHAALIHFAAQTYQTPPP